jgi:hypothetical protein
MLRCGVAGLALLVAISTPECDARGTVETKPTSDEDWARVRRATVLLAESTNLLKDAPEGCSGRRKERTERSWKARARARADSGKARSGSSPWNSHVDQLRDELLKMLEIVKARDSDKLFEAGSNIDRACETCHLEYWYPGDKAAVLRDRTSHVYGVQGGTK